MARLPIPGSDNGNWGDILNEFLLVSHNPDGTEKQGAPLILPVNLGPDLFTIADKGNVTIAPQAGSGFPLVVQSSNDGSDTVQVLNNAGSVIAAITPRGLGLTPRDTYGIGLFIEGSGVDPVAGFLVDLENGRSVVTVNPSGGTFIQPINDNVNLTLRADSSQTSNLQEWQDSSGTAQAWIGPDGSPGGKLDRSGIGEYLGVQAGSFTATNGSGISVSFDSTTVVNGSTSLNWDVSNPDYVQVLQAGIYSITGVASWQDAGATGPLLMNIFTQCGFIVTDQRGAIGDGTSESIQHIHTTLYLRPGDDIRLYVQQGTGGDLTPYVTLLVTRVS